jgi:hypothetical protein
MQNVFSLVDFRQKTEGHDRVALLIHHPDNEISRCAFRSITEASYLSRKTSVYIADLSQVQDIHSAFKVKCEPSLLLFENGELVQVIEGCHESEYFKALINHDSTQNKS